jgi:hypothetical protein
MAVLNASPETNVLVIRTSDEASGCETTRSGLLRFRPIRSRHVTTANSSTPEQSKLVLYDHASIAVLVQGDALIILDVVGVASARAR